MTTAEDERARILAIIERRKQSLIDIVEGFKRDGQIDHAAQYEHLYRTIAPELDAIAEEIRDFKTDNVTA